MIRVKVAFISNAFLLTGFIDLSAPASLYFIYTGWCRAVGNLSDCRSRGREIDPGLVPYLSEIDHDIISTAILLSSADSRRVVVSYK